MKKYLKVTGYIVTMLLIIALFAIVSRINFKAYADTPTKEVTVSKVTYEFEAEDISAKTGNAHNLRVKSKSGTSKTLTIPDEFKLDNITYKVMSFGNGKEAALGGAEWTSIVMEKGIPTINAHAFEGCTSLKTFSFKSGSKCTTIGDYAFYGCTQLEKIRNANADYTCSNSSCLPTSSTSHSVSGCSGTITSRRFKLPNTIETIGDYAFNNCDALEKLDLNVGVKTLGENTFKGTTPLTELTIRSNIEHHNNAFKGHQKITTLKFTGDSATTIYDSMFEGGTGITSVTQTKYITSIGARAFFGCTGLNAKKAITYSTNKELKVGKDAYRFGGYPEGVQEIPTINIEQMVDKADTEYYTNGIGKVTMNISANDVSKEAPKDYIVCLDTTGSMKKKTAEGRTRMEIAIEALSMLARKIYEENPNNRLAIVTQDCSSYLYMNFLDIANSEKVYELISVMKANSHGNEEYGEKSAWYTGTKNENGGMTCYTTGLKTMADVIMSRTEGRERNVYGIFISDGYPNVSNSTIQGAAAQLKGFCDGIWAISTALDMEDLEGSGYIPEDEDDEWDESKIDKNDKGYYLTQICTKWGNRPLFYDFPDDGTMAAQFNAFMESIVDVSTSSLTEVTFKSVLETDTWEFYTGTDYVNSEGFEVQNSKEATFSKIDRIGKEGKQYYYYIRLKDDKRGKTDPQLLVSKELTAEYTITGGRHNGEVCNKENGKNALYDTPLYLDWVANGDTPPDINPDPGPGEVMGPGKLEITKTGEALISIEKKEDGTIIPVYEEVKIQGAEFEIYAKEDIFEKPSKENIETQADEIGIGDIEAPEETVTPENQKQSAEQETKLLYGKDTLIKRVTTDENGKAKLENLPIGKYYIKEVKAGEGFVLNQEIKEFEIVNQGEDKTIQKIEIAYKNERQKVNLNGKEGLVVEKKADKKLYKPNEEIIYTIRITNTTQNIIKKILVKETMIQGKFEDISTNNVVKGDDTTVGIRELKPGESVELKFISISGNVTEKEKILNKVEATGIIEEPDPAAPDKMIEKEIKGEAKEEVYVSDKQLIIIKEALKDEYEVGETVQYVIKVINNGITDITDVVVEEKMLNGKFVYIEEANQGGADIKLVDNQKVTISKIEPGKIVTLRYEYEVSKDTKVTVDNEQRIILENKVTVKGKTEEPDPMEPDRTIQKDLEDEDTEEIEIKTNSEGGIGITKIDIETGKTIPGAVIGLYAAENIKGGNGEDIIARDTLIEKVTTDENGKAKYTVDLPLGKYYLKEIEAPEKYMLSEEKTEIDATYRGQEIEVINVNKTITNRKTTLDFSIDKTLSSISVDGENIPIKNNKLSKLEIKASNINKANVIVTYKIKVKNKVNIAGKVKVLEILPKGYEVVNAPEYWTARPDGILETELNLGGNEGKELEITLKWINGEANLGEGINVAKLETGGDTNTEDDISQATVIINVKTGEIVSAIIIIMIIASLGICGYITIQVMSKKEKGSDLEGIRFLENKDK